MLESRMWRRRWGWSYLIAARWEGQQERIAWARSLSGLTELFSSCGVETVRRELGTGQGGVPYISNMHCLPYRQRY